VPTFDDGPGGLDLQRLLSFVAHLAACS
jgi:hypothetical protein